MTQNVSSKNEGDVHTFQLLQLPNTTASRLRAYIYGKINIVFGNNNNSREPSQCTGKNSLPADVFDFLLRLLDVALVDSLTDIL